MKEKPLKERTTRKPKAKSVPVQQHLLIAEIKNDTVVMKDGTLRAVLMVSSINFALKNEDEQNAIVSAYVSFLNALDHPLQIVIQSRKLQIKPYLDKLITQERQQSNELLRAQIADYRSFVSELVALGEIMSKQFYAVVPYDPLSNKNKSFWARLTEVINPAKTVKLKGERFTQRKYDLDQRVRQIESGLTSMGLTVVRLDTQSLIELFYTTYNPDIALSEQLPPLQKMDVASV
jgi:type IV secretory pathway VirB4 component